ncbi:hypothetical protein CTAYLR_003631 [Chrysophaeum taylorii]|uniref:Regulator of microtubule dynamics protein 1 n=1 Tax=Chrysophaeum taylorii TaxID=2483200 RepID=A0AAD7UC37_9STRA|nr:hypothetical protein CTAYLR_003631 [Chrysophaeum taylorii]
MSLLGASGFVLEPHVRRRAVETRIIGTVVRKVRGFVGRRRKEPISGLDIDPPAEVVHEVAFEEEDSPTDAELFFQQADELHDAQNYDELLATLQKAVGSDADGADLRWRLARVYCDLSDLTTTDTERKSCVEAGLAAAEEAVALAPDSGYTQKWYGIMLGLVGDYVSTKKKIGNSYKIKDALDVASDKLPGDATVKLALGQWSYKLSNLGYLERTIASAIFGTPPRSNFGDALHYAEQAYAIRPTDKAKKLIDDAKAKLRR